MDKWIDRFRGRSFVDALAAVQVRASEIEVARWMGRYRDKDRDR